MQPKQFKKGSEPPRRVKGYLCIYRHEENITVKINNKCKVVVIFTIIIMQEKR